MAVSTPTTPAAIAGEKWTNFLRRYLLHPELKNAEHFKNYADFSNFIKQALKDDPRINQENLAPLFQDVEALHHLYEDHQDHEEKHDEQKHEQHGDNAANQLAGNVGAEIPGIFRKPQFMEQDHKLWEIVEEAQKKWDKENKAPDKNASEEERLAYQEKYTDFVYGELDDPDSKSLEDRAKEELRAKYSEKDETGKIKNEKDFAKLQRYDANALKVSRKTVLGQTVDLKFEEDYHVRGVKHAIDTEAAARLQLLKKKGLKGTELDQSYEAVLKRIQEKRWKEFINEHPEKAKYFAQKEYTNTNEDAKKEFAQFKQLHEQVIKEKTEAAKIPSTPIPKEIEESFKNDTEDHLNPSKPTEVPKDIENAFKDHPDDHLDPSKTPAKPAPTPPKPTSKKQKTGAALTTAAQTIMAAHASDAEKEEKKGFFSQTIDTANAIYNKYTGAKDWYQWGKSFFQSEGESVAGEGATVEAGTVAEGALAGEGAVVAEGAVVGEGLAAAEGVVATEGAVAATSAAAGGSAIAAGGAAASGAAVAGGGAAAGGGAVAAVAAAESNPVGWIATIIVLIILLLIAIVFLLIMLFASIFGGKNSEQKPAIPGLTFQLIGPTQIENSTDISYQVSASYTGDSEITIYDDLPADTTLVSATGNFTFTNNTLSWVLKDNSPSTPPSQGTFSFTFILHPQKQDVIVKNKLQAIATRGTIPPGGEGAPPNANNCKGQYTFTSPFNNFGDPKCNFDKDQAINMIKQLDPAHANFWIVKIIPCESGYNPNAYLGASASGLGAYGLFQMNPKGKGNGQYDAGNVEWTVQIPNAITYNKSIGNSFGYWACAR